MGYEDVIRCIEDYATVKARVYKLYLILDMLSTLIKLPRLDSRIPKYIGILDRLDTEVENMECRDLGSLLTELDKIEAEVSNLLREIVSKLRVKQKLVDLSLRPPEDNTV
jgi:hypothetical protein